MRWFRYLDRNPVRAGLVADPAPYPWSSCAAYALGTPTPLITVPPSSLALSPLGGWPMDPGARKVKVVSFYHGQTARLR